MKTRKEWFDTLPPEIRERAIANTSSFQNNDDRHVAKMMNERFKSLFAAIDDAFVWGLTPEKHDYWNVVSLGHIPNNPDKPESVFRTLTKFQLPKD